jgi:methylthioribulose-1-phosphate dehydratase
MSLTLKSRRLVLTGAPPLAIASRHGEDCHVQPALDDIAAGLAAAGRRFDAFGWTLGTSGNLSAVITRKPLRVAITPSGAAKGSLRPDQMVVIGPQGRRIGGAGSPSAEALLHVALIRLRGAGAVFHTHSIWATALSDLYALTGGLAIEGYEMLKGLSGVATHEHREWVPILENAQDMRVLARRIRIALARHPAAHGFLLRRHGLYTWGTDIAEATRHVEILEFLLEALGRTRDFQTRR